MGIRDVISRLGEEEKRFEGALFLAPVLSGGRVRVRIAGAVCELQVEGGPGWSICRALDPRRAEVVRRAELGQVRAFLWQFPPVRAVLAMPEGPHWLGLAANPAERRFRIEGLFPVLLAEGVREFDPVLLRYDGGGFLFEDRDRRRDPTVADYLRASLAALRPAAELSKRGLTASERTAYAWRLARRLEELKPPTERKLARALAHGGAQLDGYVERAGEVTVTYRVDGQPFTSVVRRETLEVVNAGVCLSGEDLKFDLSSLVGVLRERRRRGAEDAD